MASTSIVRDWLKAIELASETIQSIQKRIANAWLMFFSSGAKESLNVDCVHHCSDLRGDNPVFGDCPGLVGLRSVATEEEVVWCALARLVAPTAEDCRAHCILYAIV